MTFRDRSQPVTARVDDLLGRLTLREKVGQLNQRLLGWDTWRPHPLATTAALAEEAARWGGVGAIYGLQRADAWSGRDKSTGIGPGRAAELVAMVQEVVVKASRWGIPALLVEEAPHGHLALGASIHPVNLAAAAAWNPELVERAAAHTATELAARGVHLALLSGLDLLRDPRWGRAEETFGEDPLLASRCVRAQVRGMATQPGLGVVLKHFAAQGAGIGGRNGSGAPIGPRELAELHLPAARAGLDEGAIGIMAAYNDIDGVPCVANEWLLTTLLRDEWGFDGIVMADMFAIDRLQRGGLAPADAAALALRAGVDLSLCDVSFAALVEAVQNGLVSEELVDRACRRVLAVKIRLGLLDPPAPLPAFPPPPPPAEPALVLLHNEILPLTTMPGRVAVVGPVADSLPALLGDYVPPRSGNSLLGAVRDLVPDATHEPGCGLLAPIDGGLARAADLAAAADLVILALGSTGERRYDDDFAANGAAALGGLPPTVTTPPTATTGEGFDVAEVVLPPAQRALVDAVTATGTPTVAVIISGRPLGIDHVVRRCGAVLYAFYPGPLGAAAIVATVLRGQEPIGRLPVSLPGASGVLPVAYNERVEQTTRYVDAFAAASHAFGSGLGFTEWSLGPASASAPAVRLTELPDLTVAARLTNLGPRRGSRVVQLYARALVPGRVPRRAVLVGFGQVTLDPGTSTEAAVAVEIDARPGLGALPTPVTIELWLSITGATATAEPVRVTLTT